VWRKGAVAAPLRDLPRSHMHPLLQSDLSPYFCANTGGFYSITQTDRVSNREIGSLAS
jgi:hypothetical protein